MSQGGPLLVAVRNVVLTPLIGVIPPQLPIYFRPFIRGHEPIYNDRLRAHLACQGSTFTLLNSNEGQPSDWVYPVHVRVLPWYENCVQPRDSWGLKNPWIPTSYRAYLGISGVRWSSGYILGWNRAASGGSLCQGYGALPQHLGPRGWSFAEVRWTEPQVLGWENSHVFKLPSLKLTAKAPENRVSQ